MRRKPVIIVAIGASIVVGVVAVWLFYASSVFGVRDVTVVGAEGPVADAVLAAANIPIGTPLARLDAQGIEQRVLSVPQVASVEVRRGWPTAVVLAVDERQPVAVTKSGMEWALVDSSGTVLRTEAKKPAGYIQVEAIDVGVAAALDVITQLPDELTKKVVSVEATTRDDVQLNLRNGATVTWGSSEQSALKSEVLTALLRQKAERYDVSAPELPTTVD